MPAAIEKRMDALLAAGTREGLPRELRACVKATLDPAEAARIKVPTLLLTGELSPDPAKAAIDSIAAALPDARIVVIEGQQHIADVLVSEVFAGQVMAFLNE